MSETTYKCEYCGLHYRDESTAQSCLKWCTENDSCNLEITATSVERTLGTKENGGNLSFEIA